MQKTVAILTLIRFFLSAYSATAQTNASNLEVLQRLIDQLAVRADSVVAAGNAEAVLLKHQSLEAQSPERMLYTSLVEIFVQKSRRVYTLSDTGESENHTGVTVQFKPVACELSYRKLPSRGWFRRAPVQREARVAVDFDMRDVQTRRVYFQGILKTMHADTLEVSVERLENPSIPFTTGVWQANEGRRSWLEPALLTAATGAIIYAFYSLRSQ